MTTDCSSMEVISNLGMARVKGHCIGSREDGQIIVNGSRKTNLSLKDRVT